jgi:hypothetical protein
MKLSPPGTKLPSEYVREGWCQGELALVRVSDDEVRIPGPWLFDEPDCYPLPGAVQDWIRRFDAGDYPEYEEGGTT